MSRTDRFLYTGASWATNATLFRAFGAPAGQSPKTVTSPDVGTARPATMFMRVDFPAPFGPTSAARLPSGMRSVQSISAQDRP
jgi:hypothetical protein